MKKLFLAAPLLVVGVPFLVGPGTAERAYNRVRSSGPHRASARARELHQRLLVADLHADTLLWGRDVLSRSSRGHVDVPRLVEANVAIQAFTIVTKMPRGPRLSGNDGRSDSLTPLIVLERWPPATWKSLRERALYQAHNLDRAARASEGRLTLLRTAEDLEGYLARRPAERAITAAFLGVEGAHALEGDLANVEALFDAGVRMMAPTHFFDNDVGGSAHGRAKGGLTDLGRQMVRRMESKGMIVDLAHASPQTFAETVALARRPVVVSHSGVRGTCDNARNLSDTQLRALAATGGVVGIGFWPTAVCGGDARSVARAIRYAVKVAGVDHVALGSDFDGAVTTPFDATGLVLVTDALLNEGFTEEEVAKVMGGNTLRVLRGALPSHVSAVPAGSTRPFGVSPPAQVVSPR